MPAADRSRFGRGHALLGLSAIALLAVGGVLAGAAQSGQPGGGTGVTTLVGEVAVSNPLIAEGFSEPYVLLADLANFVRRDINASPPPDPQAFGRLSGDLARASFTLPLPIRPAGQTSDVDRGAPGSGVQIYSVDLQSNFVGDPFYGPFETETGWAVSYSSLRIENGTWEVVGGVVVVWAPDAQQSFPTDFGPDGRLFTDDDPVALLAAGWTAIDLDPRPFARSREETVELPIREGDAGLKDLSDRGYAAGFDALVAELRIRYPFTDLKRIDWDTLVAEFRPLVEQAERDRDPLAFNVAMMRFAVRFGDGHVAVQLPTAYLLDRYGGGFGFTLGQTDAGAVIVRAVATGSAAAEAGIVPGARIVQWDGRPVADALAEQELVLSVSTPHAALLQRLALLPRRQEGARVGVRYRNPGAPGPGTAELAAAEDRTGLRAALRGEQDDPARMPVTVEVLDSGIGYVRVDTFLDDLALVTHAWEWALGRLTELRVPALIVDVRGNGGGLGALATLFAGSFTAERYDLAENSFADPTGRLVYSGTIDIVPAPVRWGGPVAVLIDAGCASACEIFAAAMARDPAHLLVGQTPTAGVEAAIFPWNLPDDLYFQAPLGLLRANGEIFVEGTGVPPTIDVPVTRESLTTDVDVVLAAAERALGRSAGAAASPVATPVAATPPTNAPVP